jgi:hypothetical protein
MSARDVQVTIVVDCPEVLPALRPVGEIALEWIAATPPGDDEPVVPVIARVRGIETHSIFSGDALGRASTPKPSVVFVPPQRPALAVTPLQTIEVCDERMSPARSTDGSEVELLRAELDRLRAVVPNQEVNLVVMRDPTLDPLAARVRVHIPAALTDEEAALRNEQRLAALAATVVAQRPEIGIQADLLAIVDAETHGRVAPGEILAVRTGRGAQAGESGAAGAAASGGPHYRAVARRDPGMPSVPRAHTFRVRHAYDGDRPEEVDGVWAESGYRQSAGDPAHPKSTAAKHTVTPRDSLHSPGRTTTPEKSFRSHGMASNERLTSPDSPMRAHSRQQYAHSGPPEQDLASSPRMGSQLAPTSGRDGDPADLSGTAVLGADGRGEPSPRSPHMLDAGELGKSMIVRTRRPADFVKATHRLVKQASALVQSVAEQETMLVRQLGADADAYDAYVQATETADEAHFTFMKRLKDNKRGFEENSVAVGQLVETNEQLTWHVRKMAMEYERTQQQLKELQAREAQQAIALRAEIMRDLATRPPDQSIPPEVAQTTMLDTVASSLRLVESLTLDGAPAEEQERLAERLETLRRRVAIGAAPPAEVEAFVNDARSFVTGVKIESIQRSEASHAADGSEQKLQSDLARVRKHRDDLARDLRAVQGRELALKEEIVRLNNRLSSERDLAKSDADKYKAQVASLRAAFDPPSQGGLPVMQDEMSTRLRQQLLSMQSLVEAAGAERDVFRARAADAEEALGQARATVAQLSHQLEVIAVEEQPRAPAKPLFHDIDVENLREEREVQSAVVEQQRHHLETTLGQNKQLRERVGQMDRQLLELKRELRVANDRCEDFSLTVSSLTPVSAARVLANAAVQCDFQQAAAPSTKPVEQQLPAVSGRKAIANAQQPSHKADAPAQRRETPDASVLGGESVRMPSRPSVLGADVARRGPPPQEATLQRMFAPVVSRYTPDLRASHAVAFHIPLEVRTFSSSPSTDYVPGLLPVNESTDTYSSDIMNLAMETHGGNITGDDLAMTVHPPLKLEGKKARKLHDRQLKGQQLVQVKPGRIAPHLTKPAPMPAPPPTTPEWSTPISINNAPQGRRTLPGATVARPPIVTVDHLPPRAISVVAEVPVVAARPVATAVPCVPTTIPPTKPARAEIREQHSIDRTLEREPPVPVRITLIAPPPPPESSESSEPLIVIDETRKHAFPAPRNSLTVRASPLPALGPPPELREARARIARLEGQLHRAQEENDGLALENLALKQKVADLTLVIARLRLENIKTTADLSRARIRYDNINGRIEVCMRELGDRDSEIARLKRELANLRRDTAPVSTSLLKLKGAEAERQRLERERARALHAASVAQQARSRAQSDEVKSFLDRMIAHQKAAAARIDAQRRIWTEMERNHIMSVLAAMSLLSTSQYKAVREVLPDYSPFATSKVAVLRDLISRSREQRGVEEVHSHPPSPHWPLLYGDKLTRIDRVDPQFTPEEKRMVLARREPREIEARIEKVVEDEERQTRITDAEIQVQRLAKAEPDGGRPAPAPDERISNAEF